MRLENMQNNYHYEASKVGNRFVHWRLVRNKGGQVIHRAYPYDKPALIGATPLKRYSFNQFQRLLKARMSVKAPKRPLVIKAPTTMTSRANAQVISGITYQTGLPLGANLSTGLIPTSANCFNSTTTLGSAIAQESFSSNNAASSYSDQTNVSASISGSVSTAVASGSVNDVFTYGNNYSSSSTSGSVFFTAYQTYTASNTFYSLAQEGINSQNTQEFSTDCGSAFVSSVPVGMLITGQASYSANTVTAASTISNAFSSTVEKPGSLTNFSLAVSNAYSNISQNNGSNYNFGYTTEIIGGGEGAASIFTANFNNNAQPYLTSCSGGSAIACTSFVTAADNAAMLALATFESCFGTTPPNMTGSTGCPTATATDITNGNISGLATFPNGVAGLVTAAIQDNQPLVDLINAESPLGTSQYTDLMLPYKQQLLNYLNIYNQIATLYTRSMYLGNNNKLSLGKINQQYSYAGITQNFNPTPLIDISGSYLVPLMTQYGADLKLIIANLAACTSANSSTVSTACQPIDLAFTDSVTSAYDWYGTTLNGNGVNYNNFALQNTIALQYSGTINYMYGTFPLDVIWVQALPAAAILNQAVNSLPSGTTNPASFSGLIAFADQPYTWCCFGQGSLPDFNSPFAQLIPSNSTTISTPTNSYIPYAYYIGDAGTMTTLGWQGGTGLESSVSYGNGSTNVTFENLPSISIVNGSNTTNLSQITNFFGNPS